MNKTIYTVFLDGNFIGTTTEEDYIWDLASNCVNGSSKPLTDDDFCDRVWWNKIETGRYYRDGQTICDKLSDDRIFCGNYMEAKNGVEQMNNLQLEKERLEAKLRAMAL